jgi:hypothetical protein
MISKVQCPTCFSWFKYTGSVVCSACDVLISPLKLLCVALFFLAAWGILWRVG